ncbi:TPM domain-containing protein [Mucilaginibacter phyllosphaerae]|uniref:TPM domain-containing protein n=1 Tax=Mucilaginibacter phyllosphaerae TaxID=1812349 RepID=A0A4Y8AIG9_9SPHI|nr:TPM domain-containing protein [Mucilaginibacter phyllosphaerae]MBB3968115.1 uncharacterized protein [Mucilaginibacter phyllosphaerae]TEW68864.1 hypothetical protein E2R65_01500 [Mucilaginibacter phyllosphaerae]GGH01149.1 hypothetical protein GCM10007352_02740 [Mucilaginibacter phyllosphaerae]
MNKNILLLPFFLILLWPAQFCLAQKNYTLSQIPDPKINGNGYVSNPDEVLSLTDVELLNQTIAQLDDTTKVQIAVVVVRNFDEHAEVFDFALQLFRKWGIGKANANNGLLLFVATDRREYRFITGYGLEGLLPDVTLQKIGDKFLLPAFKQAAYGEGITNALNTIAEYLAQKSNKKELNQLLDKRAPSSESGAEIIGICALIIFAGAAVFQTSKKYMKPKGAKKTKVKANSYDKVTTVGCVAIFIILFGLAFIIIFIAGLDWVKTISAGAIPYILYSIVAILVLFRYYSVLSDIRGFYKDDENLSDAVQRFNRVAWLYTIVSPLMLIAVLIEVIRRKSIMKRFKPLTDTKGQPMARINRDENREGKPYISAGQLAEENAGAYMYDIWVSADGKETKLITNEGSAFGSFDECPRCKFKTFCKPKTITISAATYTKEGSGKEIRRCENCQYEELIKMVVLPMRTKSAGSSTSGGSSSSSSGSSSWGGGSSGGGGAGGKW